jgi:hypothetical protein
MKGWISSLVILGVAGVARMGQAQANLLVNGDFESPSTTAYYDGSDSSVADDVVGWSLSLGAADGSYVLVSPDVSGTTDVDMDVGPAGGGLQTAVGSRPAVVPASVFQASVTYDNYFAPAGASYFIDWFDVGGALLSSSCGPQRALHGDAYGAAVQSRHPDVRPAAGGGRQAVQGGHGRLHAKTAGDSQHDPENNSTWDSNHQLNHG